MINLMTVSIVVQLLQLSVVKIRQVKFLDIDNYFQTLDNY